MLYFGPGAAAVATTQVSLNEYLTTDYEPDCDYVDGELEERNLGEKEHSAVQAFLIGWFLMHQESLHLEAYPELRLRVSATRVRIADLRRIDENSGANAWAMTPSGTRGNAE